MTPPDGVGRPLTRPAFRELARWDGGLLTIDTAPYLDGEAATGGAVLVRIRVATGNRAAGPPAWDETYQPMARIPMPGELLELVATAARDRRELRILLVIECRALDEDEARAAWGDR